MTTTTLSASTTTTGVAIESGNDGTLTVKVGATAGSQITGLALDASGNAAVTGTITQGGIASGRMVLETAKATTSGTSIDFTGIPSWVKRITVMLSGVGTNGTSQMLTQLGSGSVTTTGYSCRTTSINGASLTNANSNSNGFGVNTSGNAVAAGVNTGQIIFSLLTSNTWVACGSTHDNTSATVQFIQAGLIALSGTLDRLRITTVNGTDTFDSGSVNLLYEG